jgi:hypothetical protein
MDRSFDPKERAREKQRSHEDNRALALGEISLQPRKREPGHFAFPRVRLSARGSQPLE